MDKLMKIIGEISPDNLGKINHKKYSKRITEALSVSIRTSSIHLLIVIQAIKECSVPCYKRDLLIEAVDRIIFSDRNLLSSILCNPFPTKSASNNNVPWKEMANSLASMTDLIANCGALPKYPNFIPKSYYSLLLTELYKTVETIEEERLRSMPEYKLFLIQLIGRIAISGHSQLVWEKFTSKVIHLGPTEHKKFIADILRLPLQADSEVSTQLEIFIEPLYYPIFYNLRPTKTSGHQIKSLLSDGILNQESFEYIVCNKFILQTNYSQDKLRQKVILFNIFSYLSSLVDCQSEFRKNSCLLTKTFLGVVQSWSSSTKILLRPHEHNRYISCALIIAFRHVLERDRNCLVEHAGEIQTKIMRGLQFYLSRSSIEQRNLAMCLGEILLPKLHEFSENRSIGDDGNRDGKIKLDFEVQYDEDCLDIRNLFQDEIEKIFQKINLEESCNLNTKSSQLEELTTKQQSHDTEEVLERSNEQNKLYEKSTQMTTGLSFKRPVIEIDSEINNASNKCDEYNRDKADDDDDLKPYVLNEDSDVDSDEEAGCSDSLIAPIYLRDCINGLAENKQPRYVLLCLLKAGELINQLTKEEEEANNLRVESIKHTKQSDYNRKPYVNDTIRDTAIELSRILLYLDDQFNIEDFDAHRMKALISLCLAAPDLVVKYLLDEFNGANSNTRHQLDILQALVASAQKLSGVLNDDNKAKTSGKRGENNGKNRFVKYGSLYFYGIVHQLKANLNNTILPMTILSAAKSLGAECRLDDSYLLCRILFSVSLIIKCLNQQPQTCKLSNDLLDILAAYRCHPDSGVRKAIISCLKVIQDCTPSVYFRESLQDKLVCLFGAWLANERELTITRPSIIQDDL